MALEFCNNALRSIYREFNWSFLYKRDFIRSPALIRTGTVEVEQFSNNVIVSTDLKAILDAITIDDVPLIGRQFRTFGGQIAGSNFFYTITDYDSLTSTLKIEPQYQDADNNAISFQIFKNLYTAPEIVEKDSGGNIIFQGIDFDSFEYISAPFDQRRLWLDYSRADFDRVDSARLAMGNPRYVAAFGEDIAANQLFEFYPIPTDARVYKILYKRSGRDLEPEENIPSALSFELIKVKAKIHAYEWLMINGAKVGDKTSPSIFLQAIAMLNNPLMDNSYPKLLTECKNKNENLYPQNLMDLGSEYAFYPELPMMVETILLDF